MKNDLKHIRILLIEDDDGLRKSLSVFLQMQGYQHITSVESAELAIEKIQSNTFDAIICDYWLPGMNGLDFFQQTCFSYINLKKILITAYANDDLSREANKAGIHSLIRKPFTGEEIEKTLLTLFSNIMSHSYE